MRDKELGGVETGGANMRIGRGRIVNKEEGWAGIGRGRGCVREDKGFIENS